MGTLSEVFNNTRDFYSEKGATNEEIVDAENKLGVKFADDYKQYLKLYGSVSCAGHELTGISEDTNLGVVNATLKHYKKNPNGQHGGRLQSRPFQGAYAANPCRRDGMTE